MTKILIEQAVVQAALDCLEFNSWLVNFEAVRDRLRAALEQPQAEPAKNWLRSRYGAYRGHFAWRELEEAFNAGAKAQPATQQEPVAWAHKEGLDSIKDFDASIYAKGGFDDAVPLYTTPQPATQPTPAPAGEPVAYRHSYDGYGWLYLDNGHGSNWQERVEQYPDAEPLYTTPQPRQRLTDEQIDVIWHNSSPTNFEARSFARAIEAAITGGQA